MVGGGFLNAYGFLSPLSGPFFSHFKQKLLDIKMLLKYFNRTKRILD